MFYRVILLSFILIYFLNLYSQSLSYQYTINLPNPYVYCLEEDKEGYIWAGTDNGLFRISSEEINAYYSDSGLVSDRIFSIFIDESNNKWIGTDNGINVLNNENNVIFKYQFKDKVDIIKIAVFKNYLAFITGKRYFYFIDIKKLKLKKILKIKSYDNFLKTMKINCYNDFLTLSTDYGLFKVNTSGTYQHLFIDSLIEGYCRTNNLEFVSINNKVYSYNDNKNLNKILEIDNTIYKTFSDQYSLYFLTVPENKTNENTKLYKFSLFDNKTEIYTLVNNITDVLYKYPNLFIFSTFGNGVKVYKYELLNLLRQTNDNYVTSFISTNEYDLWGTNKKSFYFSKINNYNYLFPEIFNEDYEFVHQILTIDSLNYYISVAAPSKKFVKQVFFKGLNITFFNCRRIFVNENCIWLNDYNNRLILLDKNLNVIDTFIFKSTFLVNKFVYVNNHFFVLAEDGVYKINYDDKNTKKYYNIDHIITNPSCFDLVFYNGFYIVSTRKGLLIYDPNFNFQFSITNFNQVKISRCIFLKIEQYYVLYDYYNILIIDSAKKRFITFNSNTFSINRISQLADGKIAILSSNGVYIADINKMFNSYIHESETKKFKITINQITINNYDTLYLDARNINLYVSSYTNFFNEKLNFRISVNNSNWIYLNDGYFYSNFTNPYAYYHIKIQYSNNSIYWFDAAQFSVKVKPYWFEMPIYLLILFVLIIVLFFVLNFYIVRYKSRNLKNKISILKQENELRYQNYSNSINIHFVLNTLNTIQYFIRLQKLSLANDILIYFGRYLRFVIDRSDKLNVTLYDEISRLEKYLAIQKIMFENSFDYQFNILLESSDKLQACPSLLIQPFVENSLIHGFKDINYNGFLLIKVFTIQDLIYIIIIDNGKGFKPQNDTSKSSIGIKYTIKRIKYFAESEFSYFNIAPLNSSLGTKVIIIIPKTSKLS